ncbi:MAG TPA: YsnF/AvaK domain-containing protein [Nitrososphaeraceae archaeon]|nr:YsnF/AvaK domain-containing protein [Nitrososphaeraceae archaeon]
MSSGSIDWKDVIKKEARGINDEDFGEVQEVKDNYVLVEKGIINKKKFYIPKDQAESYDGDVLKFKFSEQELSKYQDEQSSTIMNAESNSDIIYENIQQQEEKEETNQQHVPLTQEKLNVAKVSQENQATVTKKPVTETKTVEVPLTREEISIERRPPSGQTEAQNPIQSQEEIKIPLKREEVELTKKPYVKEEIVIKKKDFTDTQEITENITFEEQDTSR